MEAARRVARGLHAVRIAATTALGAASHKDCDDHDIITYVKANMPLLTLFRRNPGALLRLGAALVVRAKARHGGGSV